MSTHEKKPRPPRLTAAKTPSSLTTPPRAALIHGRSKTTTTADDAASVKSSPETDSEAASIPPSIRSTQLGFEKELEEKDARIKDLEREMGVMEDEFERELTGLSHKLTNENETSVFWQQKHSSLHQSFLKLDTELRILRSSTPSNSVVEKDRERDVKTRLSSLVMDRDAFREAYNEAMGELRERDGEIAELRGQVRGLKEFLAKTNVVGIEQIADEGFGEMWRRLGNGIQNWVISNFRRVKIDIERADEEKREELARLVPTYEALASSSKIHLIQSLVSRMLVERIFDAYFVGLSKEQSEDVLKVEKYLITFSPADSMNAWRSTTLTILAKECSSPTSAPSPIQTQTAALIQTLAADLNNILNSIGDIQHTDARDTSLRILIVSAIDLSRLLRVQKAVFKVVMPEIVDHQRTVFDPEMMEDVSGEEEDGLEEREIRCVTFPGIVKSGDENGERMSLRNVVAKIRVLCAPD